MFERWIALFYPVDNAIGFFTSYPVDSANTFEQPGPGAIEVEDVIGAGF